MKKTYRFPAKDILGTCLLLFTVFLLILDGKTASEGMVQGLLLCLQTVIPSLFPLMVLCRLLMNTDLPGQLARSFGRFMGPVFHQSAAGAICLVLGILGGYPTGAQTIALSYSQGLISKRQAEQLLTFCNNAGPSFFFGMLAVSFGSVQVAGVLYGIHILSALLTGIILRPKGKSTGSVPIPPTAPSRNVLSDAIGSMAMICACVTLFQVIAAFWNSYLGPLLPQVYNIALSGILELTGGCAGLTRLESTGWQYCLASGFLGFGGLCVWLQTKAVLGPQGLSGRYYFLGKLLHSAMAVLLTWATMVYMPGLLPRTIPTVQIPNHQGFLQSLVWVWGIFLVIFVFWCLLVIKKAGKIEKYGV